MASGSEPDKKQHESVETWDKILKDSKPTEEELDVQVAVEKNLLVIQDTLKKYGNKNVTVKIFPQINHMMQTAVTGALEEYGQIDESFSPTVMTYIEHWLQQQTNLEIELLDARTSSLGQSATTSFLETERGKLARPGTKITARDS